MPAIALTISRDCMHAVVQHRRDLSRPVVHVMHFLAYVSRWSEAIARRDYDDLAELQAPPFASLGFGGGGTAYALARLGQVPRARAWLNASLDDRRRAAFATAHATPPRTSYLHGRGGLHWLCAQLGAR